MYYNTFKVNVTKLSWKTYGTLTEPGFFPAGLVGASFLFAAGLTAGLILGPGF